MTWWWVGAAVVLALLFGVYLSQIAGRLDRLHLRIEGARAGLELQLAQRISVVQEVAGSGVLDPATSLVLADAAAVARAADVDDPESMPLAESDLTRALGAAFADRDDVWARLLEQDVLVRATGPAGWLRVSAGTPEEMAAFREAMSRTVTEQDVLRETVGTDKPAEREQ